MVALEEIRRSYVDASAAGLAFPMVHDPSTPMKYQLRHLRGPSHPKVCETRRTPRSTGQHRQAGAQLCRCWCSILCLLMNRSPKPWGPSKVLQSAKTLEAVERASHPWMCGMHNNYSSAG